MKAIIQSQYGSADLLKFEELARPCPKDDEVLVRVYAASVHPDVWHVLYGLPYILRIMGAGFFKPKNPIPGTDMAGVVEMVGKDVTKFKAGDAVFGETVAVMQWVNGGAYAEYVCVSQDLLAFKPAQISFEQAACVPTAGYIALMNLQNAGGVKPGQKVLINGAGGGVGSLALQLAKAYGAEVTGVESTEKLSMLQSLGADHVIDYTRQDFTSSQERYDLIFDIPGNHSFAKCQKVLAPSGKYLLIGHDKFGEGGNNFLGLIPRMLHLVFLGLFTKQAPSLYFKMPEKKQVMEEFKKLLESGKITPIIDKTFPLFKASDALFYMMTGKSKGRIVLTMEPRSEISQ